MKAKKNWQKILTQVKKIILMKRRRRERWMMKCSMVPPTNLRLMTTQINARRFTCTPETQVEGSCKEFSIFDSNCD